MSLNVVDISEEWRDISGYEGLYQVSNLGRVRSLERRVWNGKTHHIKPMKYLKINVMKIGYGRVTLTKDAKQKQYYVHRLVAEAFIPNPENLSEVDHFDANTLNNHADNLRWVSHKENMKHMIELGRNYDGTKNLHTHESRLKAAVKRCKPVVRSDGAVFPSIKDAARELGVHSSTVGNVLLGRKHSCQGYQFNYLDVQTESELVVA